MEKLTDPIDVETIKKDFPLLARDRDEAEHRIVFLDSAASSQHPQSVLDAMDTYYETTHANVHRGIYPIAEEATREYEAARVALGQFIGAQDPQREIVFTKNATEAVNLVSNAWGRTNLRAGDVVVLSAIEHHANIVPWLMLKEAIGIELRYLPMREDFYLDLDRLDEYVSGAKLVGITATSNVLGTVVDLESVVKAAHAAGALVLVDAAQYVPHRKLDVAGLGIDFAALTSHKMVGPTGVGALWGRADLLDAMPPFLGGGDMINEVRFDGFTPNELPWKFEAGTPPIAEVVGLAAAIDYLSLIGLDRIHAHENLLTAYAIERLRASDDIRIFGPEPDPHWRAGVVSFQLEGVHPHDVSQVLAEKNVCVRAGHHCAKPLMSVLGVPAVTRASLYLYNDESDVDALIAGLDDVRAMFK
ncbi:MAG: SufS family cysteine desulfurase [Acidimicrobiales bacterium]